MHEKPNLSSFHQAVHKAINVLRTWSTKTATLVYHDDCDGLCSAAITKTALKREDYGVKTFCLEKVYPEVIKSLHKGKDKIILYCDIGSSHADLISECNAARHLVVILDHHDPMPAMDPRVFDLNQEHHGFQGETDFSGAVCCYLFAKALSERNTDLSYLALVGSCEIPGEFMRLNRMVLDEAAKDGTVTMKRKRVLIPRLGISIQKLFSALQILGAVGYYRSGPEFGIRACLEGITPKIKGFLNQLEGERKAANKKLLARLYKEGLDQTRHLQLVDAGEAYTGMGTKVIGQFCSFLSYQRRLIKPFKYLLGFMRVPPEIPGWGHLKGSYVKVSVRVPKAMQRYIEEGKLPAAIHLLREASRGFGVADGHVYAASCILPADMRHVLIENAEKVIQGA